MRAAWLLPVALASAVTAAAQSGPPRRVFIGAEEAGPALQQFPQQIRSPWLEWVRQSDARIRARLIQGDEDSIVNLLLFGTSFTSQPRLTAQQIAQLSGDKLDAVTDARLDDLLRAMARPGGNERLAFAQRVLAGKGLNAKSYLLRSLARVLKEAGTYNALIAEADRSSVPGAAFATRSGLYRARGLSSDTSLSPNFALEEALKGIRERGLLSGPVRRIAVIGPGLDFTDKIEGHDFYPLQTLQPFALVDSLLRLGLAENRDLAVTTFDLSPRVNEHLNTLRANARSGQPYVVQLLLDEGEQWRPELVKYWTAFGDRIAAPAAPAPVPPAAGAPKLRAVAIRPEVASRLLPIDLNIVFQRLELPADERFDLIVGTNVFLYYDEFQQALAMANVGRMLRPGGLLLSNNALVELPSSHLRFAGSTTVTYSDRPGNGDTIVWYRCAE